MTQPHLPHPENPTLIQGTYPTRSTLYLPTPPYPTLNFTTRHPINPTPTDPT